MINANAVLIIHGEKIVPVRAIPFVTGGDMGPRCLANLLSDPTQNFLAFALGANNGATPVLPKHWRQVVAQLSTQGPGAPDLYTHDELAILPAATFVYWQSLWRTHEAVFLPPRELITELPHLEQINYQLEPIIRIPAELDEIVFVGFQHLDLAGQALPAVAPGMPLPLTTSEIAHSFSGLRWSAQEWMKPLGNKPKWLRNCVITPGSQGKSQTLWNPVLIGAAMVRDGHAKANSVRAKFQTAPDLKPWLETWKTFEDDNCDTT
ncbi:MAG: hypothetical protein H7274_26680 [Rhodoferax sp.]|nr:hypothetical protein [Rhodoferax sp.]